MIDFMHRIKRVNVFSVDAVMHHQNKAVETERSAYQACIHGQSRAETISKSGRTPDTSNRKVAGI